MITDHVGEGEAADEGSDDRRVHLVVSQPVAVRLPRRHPARSASAWMVVGNPKACQEWKGRCRFGFVGEVARSHTLSLCVCRLFSRARSSPLFPPLPLSLFILD